jgi:hypothetical protein
MIRLLIHSYDAGWPHWHSSVSHNGLMWETSEERVELWRMQPAEWHTLFASSQTCTPAIQNLAYVEPSRHPVVSDVSSQARNVL